jgi:hypothetical protein
VSRSKDSATTESRGDFMAGIFNGLRSYHKAN